MRGIKHRTGFTGNTGSVGMQSMHGADQYKQRAGERELNQEAINFGISGAKIKETKEII